MTYSPINVPAYTAAFSGAIAGMAVSGWITDPTKSNYSNVTLIAGAFAQAFDQVWNNAAQLNNLETATITSIVQTDFAGRGPGPFNNPTFQDPNNWTVAASACAALVLESDIFFTNQSIVPITPISPIYNPSLIGYVLGIDNTGSIVPIFNPLDASLTLIPDDTSTSTMSHNVTALAALLTILSDKQGGVLEIPNRDYHFNGPIPFVKWDRITLQGQGLDATRLFVQDLTSGQIFLDCYHPGNEIQHCTLEKFSIFGNALDGAIAIREMNLTRGRFDVRIFNWTGNKSIGILSAGREFVIFHLGINADKCIVLTKNLEFPSAELCLDHCVFEQQALYSLDPTEPCIQNDSAIDVSTVAFEGTCAFVSDGGGLKLSGMHDIVNLRLESIRHESTLLATPTGWGIELDGTHQVRGLSIINCAGFSDFVKVRNTESLTLIDCKYEGDPAHIGIALDVDESCTSISWTNFISSNGTLNIGALNYTYSSQYLSFGDGVIIPSFATLSNETIPSALAVRRANAVYSNAVRKHLLKTETISLGPANNPILRSGSMIFSAIATEIDATIVFGITLVTVFGCLSISPALQTANFSTANTPGALSVYIDSGNIVVTNNTNRDLDLTITWN